MKRYTSKTNRMSYGKSGGGFGAGYCPQTGMFGRQVAGKADTIARGYSQIGWAFEQRSRSYHTLWDQTRGTCTYKRPTPATLRSFSNWINKGAFVWRVTNTQINKWCYTDQHYTTCTSVKNALGHKFGKATIKAVTFDKSGNYLVVTAPTWKGRPFCWPQ